MHAVCLAPCRPSRSPSAHPPSGSIPARSQAVTFDPFGDFATEGYLRNFEKEKDLAIVRRAENASFMTGLDEAFATLAKSKVLAYDDVLKTHGILFGAVYPWAGQDRTQPVGRVSRRRNSSIIIPSNGLRFTL